ncbi:LOW QUALITY PROTEIN: Reverse transcriptase [Phytophthora palmivora]|uniref:Reverse transcriptase n=1 Tax=Phytophthora palmivora TaxID=4796 RepID=A0A2P4YTS5_9STRA|nr:LOW QUALITY PROTEIN: Reverse transcriptase [Phytophthora palmivora]
MDEDVLEGFTKQCATHLGSEIPKNPQEPVYHLVKEFSDVVSKHPPSSQPPSDRGVRHDIDLVPGTKYCPLPREQCEVIDAFFAEKAKSGMVRESKSPHSTPTFCVLKPNGKWRLVHAYNKLNNATVPTQTPILARMSDCTLYSALDLVDGYYQILMRESDIPLTAVSTPSGMLWEWLLMPQGLSNNTPATFNRLVTQLFRPLRTFPQTYVDDIFVHSCAEGDPAAVAKWLRVCLENSEAHRHTAIEVHLRHLRRVFEVMRANKLYANTDKGVFAAEVVKVLDCFSRRMRRSREGQGHSGLADPEVTEGPPEVVELSQLAGYVELARPLSDLLKKDADWVWEQQHLDAFDSIKASLQQAPVLALPDENKSFSVVCDASGYAIGCAMLQKDDEGRERVISFQSRQLKAAERDILFVTRSYLQ